MTTSTPNIASNENKISLDLDKTLAVPLLEFSLLIHQNDQDKVLDYITSRSQEQLMQLQNALQKSLKVIEPHIVKNLELEKSLLVVSFHQQLLKECKEKKQYLIEQGFENFEISSIPVSHIVRHFFNRETDDEITLTYPDINAYCENKTKLWESFIDTLSLLEDLKYLICHKNESYTYWKVSELYVNFVKYVKVNRNK